MPPWRCKASAMALPMPPDAPVTSATFPDKSNIPCRSLLPLPFASMSLAREGHRRP